MAGGSQTRPATVRALNVLLGVQAATALCLSGLTLITGIATWFGRSRTGNGFADLATVILAFVAAFALAALALAVLAWLALRGRRVMARWLSLGVFLMPLLAAALVASVRSPSVPVLGLAIVWAVLGAWLSFSGSTWNWIRSGLPTRGQ